MIPNGDDYDDNVGPEERRASSRHSHKPRRRDKIASETVSDHVNNHRKHSSFSFWLDCGVASSEYINLKDTCAPTELNQLGQTRLFYLHAASTSQAQAEPASSLHQVSRKSTTRYC